MNSRVPCGGLIEKGRHALVEVLGFWPAPDRPGSILELFGRAGIALSYLSVGRDAGALANMSFCVRTDELARHRTLLDEVRRRYAPLEVSATAPVVILTLYGPHFLEKTSLAAQVCAALLGDGIALHSVCSSVNSISAVVDFHERKAAVSCLRRRFSWPE